MGTHAAFDRVGASEKPLFGPRGLVVCGMTVEEQRAICDLVEQQELECLPVIFVTDQDLDLTMGEVLGFSDRHGMGHVSAAPRAVIMSGFLELELQLFLSVYRRAGLIRPLWATLTPTSKKWKVSKLLTALAEEDKVYQQ